MYFQLIISALCIRGDVLLIKCENFLCYYWIKANTSSSPCQMSRCTLNCLSGNQIKQMHERKSECAGTLSKLCADIHSASDVLPMNIS